MKKSVRRVAFFGIVVLAIPPVLFLGPRVIHAYYRAVTSEQIIQQQRAEYQRLEGGELNLSGPALTASQQARHKLFLWFHSRGLSIDEGEEEYSPWRPWSELIDYWRDDDGARYFPISTKAHNDAR